MHVYFVVLIIFTLDSVFVATGYALEIISVEQQTVEYEGSNVTLDCTVYGKGFNFFFNQVIWYKVGQMTTKFLCAGSKTESDPGLENRV